MKYLLNSAVLAAGAYGIYEYAPATPGDLRYFMASGYKSRIGYPETAAYIASITGLPAPEISREMSALMPGDEAFVVRLKFRLADPNRKGAPIAAGPTDWEIAKLTRIK